MKKRHKKISKLHFRVSIVLSLIVILTISSVGFLLFYQPTPNNNGNTQPTNTHTPNPTQPSQTTEPIQSYTNKTINKQIPAGYTMGFPVDAGLINGMDVQFIRNPNEKISIRFTAQQSGTVTKIVTDAFAYEGQPIVRKLQSSKERKKQPVPQKQT